ncbi:hypothetical protein [Methylobacterium aerolatum]|uniref:Large exoprotein involved in heme utilization or adhesion n=1 Tax=Methylobacterium aerolatum TaxID=418708 RepID=A0ABU0I4Z3_9HYPH|nr:hypothetical protein [Methylobacterium aerolatum]MDQ0449693.1 hypothetical protein [Methylobacterium aerolatum]GJD36019.1 hypothetical protein FMGBMHLM_2933 [Methylobacterium aerolatum]
MKRPFPTAPALASLALLGLAAPAGAAPAANRFDGGWSVTATGETGDCAGPYRYAIVIRDGIVDDAGGSDVDASGRTASDGRITGTIRKGLANVAVSGRLRGSAGTGRWTLTGLGSCSGRWTARRSS